MTVVAPVTAVTSAAIPVVVGLISGERPAAAAAGRRGLCPGRHRAGQPGAAATG